MEQRSKVFNPKKFQNEFIFTYILGFPITFKMLRHCIPMVVIFGLIGYALFHNALFDISFGIEATVNAWVNFIAFTFMPTVLIYRILFMKKNDRTYKEIAIQKLKYGSRKVIFSEKVNKK